jgi:trimethylamine--corrinoid protein Co-methyltransferase
MERVKHEQLGLESSLYQPLSQPDVKKIAEAAFEVLSKAGVAVYTKTGRDAFKAAGAEVDDDKRIVKLSRSLVEDCIASNPSSITLFSRDGESDCVLERNKVHYGTGGTAIYVLDPDTGKRRPSTNSDVILNARMVEQLRNVHLFTINVFPNELDDKNHIDVNRFFHALNNTNKHIMGGIYTLEGCQNVVKMAEMMAGSPDALRAKPFVSFITLIISPFKIDDDYGEMTCYLAREGLPVVVPTEPICGTTSPITLAANVLTHIAETLAGVCLVQCVNKGAPAICGSVGSITNLKTMAHLAGPIERGMINSAVSQLAQHFEIPLYSTGGTSDAKEVDVQAAFESGMSSLLVAMSGANYIHDIAGLMESDLTVSYEKLAIDNELLGACQRVLRGIEVNDDTLAVDLLIEKGPAQDYIAEEHTIRYMREEFYQPKLSNREERGSMAPGSDCLSNAKKLVQEIRENPPKPLIDDSLRNEILAKWPEIRQVEGA